MQPARHPRTPRANRSACRPSACLLSPPHRRGFHSLGAAVDAWASEARSFNFSSPGFSLLAGHFSQMVWRSTSKMGCAVNTACEWEVYSCLYYPPGNDVEADWSEQVMPEVIRVDDANVAVTDAPYSTWAPVAPAPADTTSGSGSSDSRGSAGDVTTYIPFNVPDGVAPGSLVVPDTWSSQQQQHGEMPPEEQPVPVLQEQPGDDADTPAAKPEPLKPGSPVPTMPAAQFFAPPAVRPAPTTSTPATPQTPADTALPPPSATPADDLAGMPPTAGAPSKQQQPASSPAPSTTPASPTTAAPTTAKEPSLPAEAAAVLAATNAYRAKHQAPALAWDAALAARAQAFAGGCPTGHSGDRGVGENMGESHICMHCQR
jgi:hypothetical protein